MTSGVQCVMMAGTVLMPVWSASSWVMQPLEVRSYCVICTGPLMYKPDFLYIIVQVQLHITMLGLVLVLDQSTWMMLLVLQVLASCLSALADQS